MLLWENKGALQRWLCKTDNADTVSLLRSLQAMTKNKKARDAHLINFLNFLFLKKKNFKFAALNLEY